MSQRITLKQLADLTGISVSTVGRAFSNPDKVTAKTKEIIFAKAKELNYKPNLLGRSLRTGKSYVVIVMIPFDKMETNILTGIAQYHLTSSISSVFNDSDYQLKILSYTSVEESIRLLKDNIMSQNIDYVILSQMQPQDTRVKILLEHNIPFITFGQTELASHYNFFDFDNFAFMYDACTNYIKKGYRKPVLITSKGNYMHHLTQIKAFKTALQEFRIDFHDNMIIWSDDNNVELGENLMDNDCIITISPSIAYKCKKFYEGINRQLGIDIPITCATPSIELLKLLDIRCTCYFQNFITAGQILAKHTITTLETDSNETINELKKYQVIEL